MPASSIFLHFITAVCLADAGFLNSRAKTLSPNEQLVAAAPKQVVGNASLAHTPAMRALLTPSGVANQEVGQKALPLLHANNSAQAWGAGVVHFLFLVNDNIPHAEIWRAFFSNAPQGSWKVLVHCKDPIGCMNNAVFTKNPGFIQVPTTPTWYCHDLVTAMAHLVAGALQLNAAAVGSREKFVFLSESALPIKPFDSVHSALLVDDNSDFCLFPSDQWASASIDGSFVKLVKHHQWVVLSRSHAEQFAQQWAPVNSQSQWQIWLKSGTWEANHRYVYPQNFNYPASANTCTDEYAFMATIFGALETQNGVRHLPGFGGGNIDMSAHTTQGQCRTWSYWESTWDPQATQLASAIANDYYGSSLSCYPSCHARPATLEQLSITSLHHLRSSQFLFARKFSATIHMPDYYDIVLSP